MNLAGFPSLWRSKAPGDNEDFRRICSTSFRFEVADGGETWLQLIDYAQRIFPVEQFEHERPLGLKFKKRAIPNCQN